jgi:aspartokinase/homoserine dehydrogenase 1
MIESIPIRIRNTFEPAISGTKIHVTDEATQSRSTCVCGFTTVDGMALINVENTALPGVAHRVFGALHGADIRVTLITQASSQNSVTFVIKTEQAQCARDVVGAAFASEMITGAIGQIEIVSPCSIIAAVGDGMSTTAGICGRFFDALGTANVNVLAIAMGCSGRNISCVVHEDASARALRAVHGAFMLSTNQLSVAVIGTGRIGAAVVKMIDSRRAALVQRYNCSLELRAWCNTRGMVLSESSDVIAAWGGEPMDECAEPTDLRAIAAYMRIQHGPYCVIVDCTSSHEVAEQHPSWLGDGIHVVCANMLGVGGPSELFERILAQKAISNYNYETTVGAKRPRSFRA